MRTKTTSILAAVLLAFATVGCTGDLSKGPTYPVVGTIDQTKMEQSAFAARSAYAGILHLMAEYVVLPRCGTAGSTVICSDQSVVNEMRRYELAADTATKGAADLARSPSKTASALANAVADALRAVAIFRSTVAAVKPQAMEAS
jgi:hypothetical protein